METVEFLERSLVLMLMRYCCSMIGCYSFSRHYRFAETHSRLQLSYHITDRLLAAGNKKRLFWFNTLIYMYRLWMAVRLPKKISPPNPFAKNAVSPGSVRPPVLNIQGLFAFILCMYYRHTMAYHRSCVILIILTCTR